MYSDRITLLFVWDFPNPLVSERGRGNPRKFVVSNWNQGSSHRKGDGDKGELKETFALCLL